MDPTFGLITAGVSTGLSLALGSSGAKKARKAQQEQNEAAVVTALTAQRSADLAVRQMKEAAGIDIMKMSFAMDKLHGLVEVAEGAGQGGNVEALKRQASFDAAMSSALVERNMRERKRGERIKLRQTLVSLAAGLVDPGTAGARGGLAGISAGMKMGSMFGGLLEAAFRKPKKPSGDDPPGAFGQTGTGLASLMPFADPSGW